jgi:hypothetical protein
MFLFIPLLMDDSMVYPIYWESWSEAGQICVEVVGFELGEIPFEETTGEKAK